MAQNLDKINDISKKLLEGQEIGIQDIFGAGLAGLLMGGKALGGGLAGLTLAVKITTDVARGEITSVDEADVLSGAFAGYLIKGWKGAVVGAILTYSVELIISASKDEEGLKRTGTAVNDWLITVFEDASKTAKEYGPLGQIISGVMSFAGSAVSFGGGIGQGLIDFFNAPRTATGGIVTQPQVRLVGEAGPEAIIPLNQANNSIGQEVYAPQISVSASIGSDYDVHNLAEELNRQLYVDYKRSRMTWA